MFSATNAPVTAAHITSAPITAAPITSAPITSAPTTTEKCIEVAGSSDKKYEGKYKPTKDQSKGKKGQQKSLTTRNGVRLVPIPSGSFMVGDILRGGSKKSKCIR